MEYITKMKSLAHNYNTPGQTISDDELILYIFWVVGSGYESVVINLTSRQGDLDLHEVQFMFQSWEMRLEALNSDPNSLTGLMFANTAYSGQ